MPSGVRIAPMVLQKLTLILLMAGLLYSFTHSLSWYLFAASILISISLIDITNAPYIRLVVVRRSPRSKISPYRFAMIMTALVGFVGKFLYGSSVAPEKELFFTKTDDGIFSFSMNRYCAAIFCAITIGVIVDSTLRTLENSKEQDNLPESEPSCGNKSHTYAVEDADDRNAVMCNNFQQKHSVESVAIRDTGLQSEAVLERVVLEQKAAETVVSKDTNLMNRISSGSRSVSKLNHDDDKMDLDSDTFDRPLVIAEPNPLSKDDTDNSEGKVLNVTNKEDNKAEDPGDEEIDVVEDGKADSGRATDVSSRTESRSLSGDGDLGSIESVPKAPEAECSPDSLSIPKPAAAPVDVEPKPENSQYNGMTNHDNISASSSINNECDVLDLSTRSRKRSQEGNKPSPRAKPIFNPAVLDKTLQIPFRSPEHPSFEVRYRVPTHTSAFERIFGNLESDLVRRRNKPIANNPDLTKILFGNLVHRPDRYHEHFQQQHRLHHQRQRM